MEALWKKAVLDAGPFMALWCWQVRFPKMLAMELSLDSKSRFGIECRIAHAKRCGEQGS